MTAFVPRRWPCGFVGWDGAMSGGSGDVEAGPESVPRISLRQVAVVSALELRALLHQDNVVVMDLATSRDYRKGHIPGAWFVVRSRLGRMLGSLPKAETTILTSEDGVVASFAATDDVPFEGTVKVLEGGTETWRRAGFPLSSSLARFIDEPDDVVLKPSELSEGREAAMRDYLSGSEALLDKVRRDGTLHLAALPVRL
jgi:rhodanese-related sulfurtransferase